MTSQTHQLTMRTGPTPGKVFPLAGGEVIVGRDSNSAQLVIADAEVSRKHSRITQQGNAFILEDLGSTNGTFVNGQRIAAPTVLQAGDIVQLGEKITLVFEVLRFDPDATMASAGPLEVPNATQMDAPRVVIPSTPPPPPMQEPVRFTQPEAEYQAPPMRMEQQAPPPQPKKQENKAMPWILAGCGCLTIVCILAVAAIWYIDSNFLWCSVLPILPGCP